MHCEVANLLLYKNPVVADFSETPFMYPLSIFYRWSVESFQL